MGCLKISSTMSMIINLNLVLDLEEYKLTIAKDKNITLHLHPNNILYKKSSSMEIEKIINNRYAILPVAIEFYCRDVLRGHLNRIFSGMLRLLKIPMNTLLFRGKKSPEVPASSFSLKFEYDYYYKAVSEHFAPGHGRDTNSLVRVLDLYLGLIEVIVHPDQDGLRYSRKYELLPPPGSYDVRRELIRYLPLSTGWLYSPPITTLMVGIARSIANAFIIKSDHIEKNVMNKIDSEEVVRLANLVDREEARKFLIATHTEIGPLLFNKRDIFSGMSHSAFKGLVNRFADSEDLVGLVGNMDYNSYNGAVYTPPLYIPPQGQVLTYGIVDFLQTERNNNWCRWKCTEMGWQKRVPKQRKT